MQKEQNNTDNTTKPHQIPFQNTVNITQRKFHINYTHIMKSPYNKRTYNCENKLQL